MRRFCWIVALIPLGTSATYLRHSKRVTGTAFNQTLSTRALASDHRHFKPLDCNIPQCNKGTTTWMDQNYDTGKKVVIPCGVCVIMDYYGEEDQVLELPRGLEVLGTLTFPNNYRLTIETPFIIVQGTLRMAATGRVSDTPIVEVKLTGTEEVTFLPIENNSEACGGGRCSVGTQPIVVAGGKVVLLGIASTCKTWVRLVDVVSVPSPEVPYTLNYETPAVLDPSHANPLCRRYDPYVNDNFDAGTTPSLWTGGDGASYDWSRGFLRVSERKDALKDAPTLDLQNIRDCLIADQTYLFSARIRLRNSNTEAGPRTPCADDGYGCLTLQATTVHTNSRTGIRKGREFPSDAFVYNAWEDFYASFTFSADEIDSNAVYQLFRLGGPSSDVDIDVDDVSFGLPPPFLYPDPTDVCGGNLIMNGDAGASPIHPFPISSKNGKLRVIASRSGNRFFRLMQRSDDTDSIQYDLVAPQCIRTRSQYSVRARLRFLANGKTVNSNMMVRVFFNDGTFTTIKAATCTNDNKGWEECKGKFMVIDEFESNTIETVRIFFRTEGAPNVSMDVVDWDMRVSRPAKSGILVPSEGVADCWDEGAQIALTSHTLDLNDAQVRQLVSAPVQLGDGTARLELDDAITFPVSEMQDKDFAVEVVLLNRNIRFQGGTEQANRGGHFMVYHTPMVTQLIRGIEFRNFGQLGDLGRYPIHMHMCESTQTRIEKNLIIDSNQRCVVIHATHNTTVSENVAFRTRGHCFMTEDGGEMDNRFERNLGALTRAASKIVRPGETDGSSPSTFWISNPRNEFIGNVAAGSEGNGFWFELQTSVKSPSSSFKWAEGVNPRELELSIFRDNVAHSNWRSGFRTYPTGMFPPSLGVFENIRSYKNRQDGVFLRSSENIMLKGGVFADNQNQMNFEISQNIVVDGSKMIGRTQRFGEIVEAQNGVLAHTEDLVGVQLHVRTADLLEIGSTIKNVEFQGFHQDSATRTRLFDVDIEGTRTWDGIFTFWSTLENIVVDALSVTNPFDLKWTSTSKYAGVYFVDYDSSLKPLGTSARTSSTIIADVDDVKAFCNLDDLCHRNIVQGYWYCRNTCLRTVIFAVDPTNAEGVELEIVDTTDPSRSFSYTGAFASEILDDGTLDEIANTDWNKYVSFAAALPVGSYRARFKRGTQTVWPTFVETIWGPALCEDGAAPDSVMLVEPNVRASSCDELIRNGKMEDGTLLPWLHAMGGGLSLEASEGRSKSMALADMDQSLARSGMGQYVDTRCLSVGSVYEIRVWVRMEHSSGLDVLCRVADCGPKLKVRTVSDRNGLFGIGTPLEPDKGPLSTQFDGPLQPDWNLLSARVTVDEELSNALSVFIYVERGITGKRLFIDDFTMTRVED